MNASTPPLRLTVTSGPGQGQTFTIQDKPQTIGRGKDSDIVISDEALSRHHAKIRPTARGYVIEDLGSTNGTFVNEQPVSGGRLLKSGDLVRLGATVQMNTFLPGADLDATMAAPPVRAGATPAARSSSSALPWIIAGLALVLLLVVGALVYMGLLSPAATVAPAEVAQAPTEEPTATPLPPTEEPTAEPTTPAEPLPVPGLAAGAAPRVPPPPDALNVVNPSCNGQVEVIETEPVLVRWMQPLAEPSGEMNYTVEWLASAHYELTVDGRPVDTINVHQDEGSPNLTFWASLGVLPPGSHFVRLQWYSSRQISSGLDLRPTDGEIDTFGPGPAGEGSCEIIVPVAEAVEEKATEEVAQALPTPTATTVVEPTATATPVVIVIEAPTVTPLPPTLTPVPIATATAPPAGSTAYELALGSQHRYEEPWGAPIGDPCRAWEDKTWDDERPNYRGFNVELLLTNNSDSKVEDDWGEDMRFITSKGQDVAPCYYGYDGAGPVPEGQTSLTFFSVVPQGEFVETMQLDLNGERIQICLDGRGGWSPC